MRMRLGLTVAFITIGSLVGAAAAEAATYDLATDLYTANQPGSAWKIEFSSAPPATTPLAHVSHGDVINNNHLYPAIPDDGIFGTGGNLNENTPFVFRAKVPGSQTGLAPNNQTLTDQDFAAGDVVVHSPNDTSDLGQFLSITWTAPSAGKIDDLVIQTWYAHSTVDPVRSSLVALAFAGDSQSWTLTETIPGHNGKSNAANYSNDDVNVNAGDLLTLKIMKSAGQQFGSLAGLSAHFTFTAAATATTPIPAALPLFASGLVGLGWVGYRRRKQAA